MSYFQSTKILGADEAEELAVYPSGQIGIASASGTPEIPIYASNPVPVLMTSGNNSVVLEDSSGNYIASHVSADGDYHLGISMEQNVVADPNNSSTANLASGATFTGTATSTLGVVGLQWSLYTTENCTVYIDQSPDGTNWDISYQFDYIASKGGEGETVQATQSYWRIRVTNIGESTTTTFRLQGVLCPIATPLPSSLSPDARLKTETTITGKENTSRHGWISPTNTQGMNTSVRLVGTNFDGAVKDPNFWTETITNAGSVVQTGEIKLQTNTTANGTARYESVRRARFVVGSALMFTGAFKFNDTVTEADNLRRFGAYDGETGVSGNGFFFQLDSGVFSVGTRKEGTDTLISSGAFNGNYGVAFTPSETLYYKFDIEYTPLGAFYYINGKLLHQSVGGHLTRVLTLPIRFENNNDNNNATAVIMDCLGVVIMREGELFTNPTYKRVSGVSVTVLKYGAGTLKGIVVSNVTNTADINIYDGVSIAGIPIWTSGNQGARTEPFNIDFYGLPFSDGLTLQIVDAGADVLVVYE